MIKLIVSDVDGTLVPEGTNQMHPGIFSMIRKLKNRAFILPLPADVINAALKNFLPRFGTIFCILQAMAPIWELTAKNSPSLPFLPIFIPVFSKISESLPNFPFWRNRSGLPTQTARTRNSPAFSQRTTITI